LCTAVYLSSCEKCAHYYWLLFYWFLKLSNDKNHWVIHDHIDYRQFISHLMVQWCLTQNCQIDYLFSLNAYLFKKEFSTANFDHTSYQIPAHTYGYKLLFSRYVRLVHNKSLTVHGFFSNLLTLFDKWRKSK